MSAGHTGHAEVVEALGAWVLDACPEREAEGIAGHVATCPRCAAEAAVLREATAALASTELAAPPVELRAAARTAAFRRRAPLARAAASYAAAVAGLDALLQELTPAQWQATVPRHHSVHDLVVHLASSD